MRGDACRHRRVTLLDRVEPRPGVLEASHYLRCKTTTFYTGSMEQLTRLLLGALIFTLPFDQAFRLGFVGSLSRTVGLVVALVAILTVLSQKTIRLKRFSLLLVCTAVFVAWNVVSTLWSIDRTSTLTQSFTYLQLLVFAWLLWQFVTKSSQARALRQAYLLGTWFTIGTVVWGFITHNPTIDPTRFTAFDTNANYTAQSIALAVPMAFEMLLNGRGIARISAGLLIPASLYGIALTGSRSGGIMVVVALLLSITLIMRGNRTAKVVLLTGVAAAITVLMSLLPPETVNRFTGTLNQVESADFSGRGEIWAAGFEAWLSYPVAGSGSGNFIPAMTPILGYGKAAHNAFLALLVELGPLGVLLFLLLFIVGIWPHALTLIRSKSGGAERAQVSISSLHVVLYVCLFLAQLPANWQYQRVAWYVLISATIDGAVFLRWPSRRYRELTPRPTLEREGAAYD